MKKLVIPAIAFAALLLVSAGAQANSISVTANAAMEGNYGMEVDYTGGPSLAFVVSGNVGANPHAWSDETGIRFRFLIDPGDPSGPSGTGHFGMGAGGEVRFSNIFMDYTPGYGVKVVLFLKKSLNNNSWRMSCYVRNGANGADGFVFGGEGYLTGLTPAYGTSTIVEFEWEAASSPGANDGRVKATRKQFTNPGGSTITIFERTDIDNDDHRLNILRLGSISSSEVGSPSGYFKLDSVVISRI